MAVKRIFPVKSRLALTTSTPSVFTIIYIWKSKMSYILCIIFSSKCEIQNRGDQFYKFGFGRKERESKVFQILRGEQNGYPWKGSNPSLIYGTICAILRVGVDFISCFSPELLKSVKCSSLGNFFLMVYRGFGIYIELWIFDL